MISQDRKTHWENVFQTKDTSKVSWFEPVPTTSLRLINELNLSKEARIMEVGAGDSFLGDFLLEQGYQHITLLDISEKALERIKNRLAGETNKISFEAVDVTQYSSPKQYDLWHDRAVFHFLSDKADIEKYTKIVAEKLPPGGYLIIGTFSDKGPEMCSNLKVQQYSEDELTACFENKFSRIKCFGENHKTPSGSIQNFTFCVFKRKKS